MARQGLRTKLQLGVTFFSAYFLTCLPALTQQKFSNGNDSVATVRLFLSATAKKGGLPPQVTTADVSVIDDGNRQNLTSLTRADELPLALGILLDSSFQKPGPWRGAVALKQEQKIVSDFLNALVRAQDQSLQVNFAETSPNLGILDFADQVGMQQVVDLGRSPDAGADLLQAIDAYRGRLLSTRENRRAIVIIANGGTFLGKDVYKKIVDLSLRENIVVHVIDVYPGPGRYSILGPSDSPRARLPQQVEALAGSIKQSLKDLATDTGGIYLAVSGDREMSKAFSQLREQVNSQYIATYSSSRPLQAGQFHKIEVRAADRSISIQAPRGYYVPSL